jgi:spore maturation protein CgeB
MKGSAMGELKLHQRAPLRILFVGAQNPGSHSGGMMKALIRANQVIQSVDPRHFIPTVKSSMWLRMIRKALTRSFEREFNLQILRDLKSFNPDVMVVYKGESVMPGTLKVARAAGVYCVNIYPDVSIFTHGPWLPKTLPLYDHHFTTKSFGPHDLKLHLGLTNVTVLPHGSDPGVHCPLPEGASAPSALKADVSFIGTWSPKKEAMIDTVIRKYPGIDLKIWGSQWGSAQSAAVREHAMGMDIMGNVYAVAIQGSTINLAILSEARVGSSAGDQTTSRTFNIPSSGGFMLHERTDELLTHFTEGEEVACFSSSEELAEKIGYYLAHGEERERIRLGGHKRCLAEHSIDHRARGVLEFCYEQLAARLSTLKT